MNIGRWVDDHLALGHRAGVWMRHPDVDQLGMAEDAEGAAVAAVDGWSTCAGECETCSLHWPIDAAAPLRIIAH